MTDLTMIDLTTPLTPEEMIERIELLQWMDENKELVNNMPMWNGHGPAPEYIEKMIRLLNAEPSR